MTKTKQRFQNFSETIYYGLIAGDEKKNTYGATSVFSSGAGHYSPVYMVSFGRLLFHYLC